MPYANVQAHWYNPYVPSWNLSAYSFADALGNYIINYDSGYYWYCLLVAPITYKCQIGSDIDDLIPCMVSSNYHPYDGMSTDISFAMAWYYEIPYSKSDCTNLCFHITNSLQNYYLQKTQKIFPFKKGSIFIADAAYDIREFYNFIVDTIKGQAYIPLNPRNPTT